MSDSFIRGCIRSIENLYDPQQRLFVNLRDLTTGVNHDLNLRYTAMTLVGLYRAEQIGYTADLPLADISAAAAVACESAANAGDVAINLWAAVVGRTSHAQRLWSLLRDHRQVNSFRELRVFDTMELAWIVTAAALLWGAERDPAVQDAAMVAYNLLCRAQHPSSGLFSYSTHRLGWTPAAIMHARQGTFANQSYPIYALATYSQMCDAPHALRRAEACADTICRLQGPLGQWWWIYDVVRGRVVEKYGVYSVHQDGMAPMALDRIRLAGGKDYRDAIARGWNWLLHNELGENMVQPETHHIRRAIIRRGLYRVLYYINIAFGAVGIRPIAVFDTASRLKVLEQTRPYHPGWALVYLCGDAE